LNAREIFRSFRLSGAMVRLMIGWMLPIVFLAIKRMVDWRECGSIKNGNTKAPAVEEDFTGRREKITL